MTHATSGASRIRRRVPCARAIALAGIAALGIAGAPQGARADDSTTSEAGMGALAALSTLLYGPAKIVYATGGLIVGGFAWALSGGDGDVLHAVLTPSVRGDYVVTPDHLTGNRTLEFFGRDPRYRRTPQVAQEQYGNDRF